LVTTTPGNSCLFQAWLDDHRGSADPLAAQGITERTDAREVWKMGTKPKRMRFAGHVLAWVPL